MPKYARKGLPDIIIVTTGKVIGLEVKVEGGQLRPEQKDFREQFQMAGGIYHVVHSTTECETIPQLNTYTTRHLVETK